MSRSLVDVALTRALHLVARGALRVRSPLDAKATVDRLARRLRPLEGVVAAREAMREISRSGSCLSRALTVGARLPGAEVVIGMNVHGAARPAAHAWVELEGMRVETSPPEGGEAFAAQELARLPRTVWD